MPKETEDQTPDLSATRNDLENAVRTIAKPLIAALDAANATLAREQNDRDLDESIKKKQAEFEEVSKRVEDAKTQEADAQARAQKSLDDARETADSIVAKAKAQGQKDYDAAMAPLKFNEAKMNNDFEAKVKELQSAEVTLADLNKAIADGNKELEAINAQKKKLREALSE